MVVLKHLITTKMEQLLRHLFFKKLYSSNGYISSIEVESKIVNLKMIG